MTADNSKSKPSRSEIEHAVGGSRASSKRTHSRGVASPPMEGLQLESASHNRRQQVIGGDLTGISRRGTKRGWLGRLSEINFINLIAVGIVLAILGVFFWPTDSANVVREVNAPADPEIAGYQGVERADEPAPEAGIEDVFSRDDDMERANEFRLEDTQQRQVTLLLAAARQHVAAGEYSQPADLNAVSRFRQVLQIDSRNRAALDGLEFIRGRFLTNGYSALEQGNGAAAESALQKIEAIERESDEAIELAQAIKTWRTEGQIDQFLAQARQARTADQLILPARDNALYFYQQVLELEADNQPALQGIKEIADEYVNKANAAVLEGQLEAATGYLATVSVIDPKHPSISLIESMIAKAEPIAERRRQNESAQEPRTARQETRTARDSEATSTAGTTTLPRRPERVSNNKTPASVSREREALDRQYLSRGLDAYYRGDYEEAVGLLQPLADRGIARAQFRLGYMYYLGRGFDRDRKTADEIIRAALPAVQKFADEGRGWAQSDIGSLYEDGLVLPRDFSEAIYWYRSAAQQGYPGAQTNLGVMYARGRGVPANRKTAIEWFQRAAKQGDIAAIRNLETMGIKP